MEEKKNIEYKFRVTQSESNVLEKRFADAQMKSMIAFLRQMLVNGIYIEFDINELRSIRKPV